MLRGMASLSSRFWAFYERHYNVTLAVTTFLFALQVVHLYWLAAHVIALRLVGVSYFTPNPIVQTVIILVDYSEIPALVSTTFLYLYDLRKRFSWKALLFLVFLNSQWLHLFWITDEFVVDQFSGKGMATVLPAWLAWVAILIDYLEVPVIVDTFAKLAKTLRKGNVKEALEVIRDRD
jgi:hypothetical protein